jgi:16S rRNA G966 N2-methylase RsmD
MTIRRATAAADALMATDATISAAPIVDVPPSSKRQAVPGLVKAGKNTLIYGVHSYSTKVPPLAITPFIEQFTSPGELVLDPFAGSGMTGVAAILLGRRARLSDVAPASIHIAANYVTPCDASRFMGVARRIMSHVESLYGPLYRTTCDRCGDTATIEYTVWSDVFLCRCGAEISYWHVAVDRETGSVRSLLTCGACGTLSRKTDLTWLRATPVSTKYSCRAKCGAMIERAISAREIDLARRVESEPVSDWYPTTPFGPDREMWRKSHEVMGINSVDGFYTRRNLKTLAGLWRLVTEVDDARLRSALRFAFTAMVNRASRRYQWNAKRPTNVQTGTLYISSLNYEWNVLSLFRRKVRDVHAYYAAHPNFPGRAEIVRESATRLTVPDNSVDYIFTDPPFGANIYYADCALLWESWLGEHTSREDEILIHTKQRTRGGNSLADYERLMTEAFIRMREVLKPGRMASVVFHSSHADVWRAIQDSVRAAGFELVGTTSLDKGQPSIKGLKGQRGIERVAAVDVVLTLRRPAGPLASVHGAVTDLDLRALVLDTLSSHLASLAGRIPEGSDTRRLQHLHTLAVRTVLEHELPFDHVSFAFVEELCHAHFNRRGEYWYLPHAAAESTRDRGPQLDLIPDGAP